MPLKTHSEHQTNFLNDTEISPLRVHADVWRAGYAAQQGGKSQSKCPHNVRGPKGKTWLAGWERAQRDANTTSEAADWSDDPDDENYHPNCDAFAIDIDTEYTLAAQHTGQATSFQCLPDQTGPSNGTAIAAPRASRRTPATTQS